jgi:hypothetical protein
MHQYMTTILEKVLTDDLSNLAVNRPKTLYHYTSLETIQKIMEYDNVRLSHAEYSNDRHEIVDAINLISGTLNTQKQSSISGFGPFCNQVEVAFIARPVEIDAYIFCMCAGLNAAVRPQDMLSQWRAYAQDGRGGALSLDMAALTAIVYHLPGLRINPVVYDAVVKAKFVNAILVEGYNRYQQLGHSAIGETVEALLFCTPLMKHDGFQEEREWRLIYVPRDDLPTPLIQFHPRRDFLAPYVDLKHLYTTTSAAAAPGIHSPPVNVPQPKGNPLIPVDAVMVGPSGHQGLNVRAMKKVVSRFRPSLSVDFSRTPYRSLG